MLHGRFDAQSTGKIYKVVNGACGRIRVYGSGYEAWAMINGIMLGICILGGGKTYIKKI